MARGRKKLVLPPAVEAEIAARTARGESAETIKANVPGAPSLPTIERRQADLRKGKRPTATRIPTPTPTPGEDVPEEVPENTPIEMIDRWIARVEKGASAAEKAGNLPALSSLAMRAASLAEARRKAMPLPKPDPNENPDMIKLAEQGEELIAKTIAGLFE